MRFWGEKIFFNSHWSSRNYFKWKTYWHIEIKTQLIRRIIGNKKEYKNSASLKRFKCWSLSCALSGSAKNEKFHSFLRLFSLFLNQWHNVSKWTLYKYSSRPVAVRRILHGGTFVAWRSSWNDKLCASFRFFEGKTLDYFVMSELHRLKNWNNKVSWWCMNDVTAV